MRPRLLDTYCGAGGAAMGYHRAGFEVVGVDNRPIPRYPYEVHQADALDYIREHGHEFDAIHASPPCQAHTTLAAMWPDLRPVSLVDATRWVLEMTGRPWVIENVPGAPLREPLVLCGTMFGLGTGDRQLRRHRLFESPLLSPSDAPAPCAHRNGSTIGVYGHTGGSSRRDRDRRFGVSDWCRAMSIAWMTGAELSQAIPPAYTEWVGTILARRLTEVLR